MTDSQGPAKEGWQGRYFEDFQVGDIYRYPHGRTVTRWTIPSSAIHR